MNKSDTTRESSDASRSEEAFVFGSVVSAIVGDVECVLARSVVRWRVVR
jgi:hypothetical protein